MWVNEHDIPHRTSLLTVIAFRALEGRKIFCLCTLLVSNQHTTTAKLCIATFISITTMNMRDLPTSNILLHKIDFKNVKYKTPVNYNTNLLHIHM